MLIYKIENFSFKYYQQHTFALQNINLNIEDGRFYLICGRSGSGKSTFLQLLKKQIQPSGEKKGYLKYYGDVNRATEIGFLFQNPDFQIVTHKVIHELSFGLENAGMPLSQMKRRLSEVVHFFNLQSILHKDISQLSGGQKQIVNLAALVAMQPKVLLLDEPTAQLDPIAIQEFLNILKRVHDELNITVIMVEHDLEQTLHLCSDVIYFENGQILYNGQPEAIPFLENFEKALPVSIQLSHYFREPILSLQYPWLRQWLHTHQNDFSVKHRKVSNHTNSIIELRNVHFSYNDYEILNGLDLKIYQNEILAIVGSNGSGKSTLIKVICGLLKKDRGKIFVQNQSHDKIKKPFPNIFAYLPQDPTTLFLKETIKEELEGNHTGDIINQLELEHLFDQHPYDISGGQQQLVALVKVLSQKPKVLLLDEPTKGMDMYYKDKIGTFIRKLSKKMTIIMVTHDLEFCARYADRVGMMFEGQIESVETPQEFFTSNLFYTTMLAKLMRGIVDDVYLLDELVYD